MTNWSADEAIDAARIHGNVRPLETLVGLMIRKFRDVNAEEVNEIRLRVFLSLSKLLAKGQDTRSIANRLRKIVHTSAVDEHRFRTKLRSEVAYDEIAEEAFDNTEPSVEEVIIASEEIDEIRSILERMRTSAKASDRKYYVALHAWATGRSVHEVLRESEPEVSANNASQILVRAKARLKTLYFASKGEQVS